MRLLLALAALAWLAAPRAAAQAPPQPERDVPPDLANYVAAPDAAFKWELASKNDGPVGTIYTLKLVSQKWQGVEWDHDLQVVVPKGVKPQATMLLWNQGGQADMLGSALATTLANKIGAPVAFLYGVPKQPLYNGLKEDALIAETFVQYLKTKDATWPLLFPMAKSVVKAMDALQAFAKDEWKFEVKDFLVTGASKRGWTSWLVAATGDKRVKAIAPMVIDTLNFPAQMKNQVAAFGKPSAMIADYTKRGLVPIPDTPEAQKLWTMIDPWVYRDKLTLPKLLIFGTNDPYWPQDALNSYWNDLKGEKYLLYVPNAGHDLREAGEDGKKQLLPESAVATLTAFARAQIFGKAMGEQVTPAVKASEDGRSVNLVVPGSNWTGKLWRADAATRDFRKSRWASIEKEPIPVPHPVSVAVQAPPAGVNRAAFLEFAHEQDGHKYTLSSPIVILPGAPPVGKAPAPPAPR